MSLLNDDSAIFELMKSIKFIVSSLINKAKFDRTTNGIIRDYKMNGIYGVDIKGASYDLPSIYPYLLSTGDIVKIIIPENNMSLAFILGKVYKDDLQ